MDHVAQLAFAGKRMRRNRAKSWFLIEDAFWTVTSAIVGPLYKILIGWWAERYFAKKEERRLARDVKLSLKFLFVEEGARIVPNVGVPFPPSFDYAFLTVALDSVSFRFTRGRAELKVEVAPAFAPTDWHDLSLVLSAIQVENPLERQPFLDLWDVSRVLKPQMRTLLGLFSADHFNDFKLRLKKDFYIPAENSRRVLEAEINWRLYGGDF